MTELNSKIKNEFINIFHVSVGVKQQVACLGVAEAFITHLVCNGLISIYGDKEIAKRKVLFQKLVDQVGEIVIIDRELLLSSLNKAYNFKAILNNTDEQLNRSGTVLRFNSIYELIGLTEVYSTDEIYDINRNFDIYRNAIHTTLNFINRENSFNFDVSI